MHTTTVLSAPVQVQVRRSVVCGLRGRILVSYEYKYLSLNCGVRRDDDDMPDEKFVPTPEKIVIMHASVQCAHQSAKASTIHRLNVSKAIASH